ncbi:MAG: LiaF transmembrane domain-containing protein [Lachnospiraceae bacterium]
MKKRNWFWGIFFILAAVALIVMYMGVFEQIGFWTVLITIALAAIVIQSLVHFNFPGILIPLSILYVVYQQPLGFLYIKPWILILAALLASIGLSMMFTKRSGFRTGSYYSSQESTQDETFSYGGYRPQSKVEEGGDENHPYVEVRFGASTRYMHGNQIEQASFDVSFGSLEVFFNESNLSNGQADVFLNCKFGSIVLYLPRSWKVTEDVSCVFAGLTDERRHRDTQGAEAELKVHGTISFGGVEIKYI